VVDGDLVDAFDEACRAGIVIEEPGGRYRFNHAIVRQSLLAELASVRRMRLHQRIAATLETEHGSEDELLAELAYHYFECAWAGNAAKAVEYCRRAADQAMARLAYEGAADLYDKALHALEELDEELPDREDLQAELLVARCEALLAAGDVASAAGAVSQLQDAAGDSARLAAWGTCFDGQLSMLTHPERLDEIESAVAAAAEKLAGLDDAAGEAKAHTVRAACLGRLGRIADCETALDQALTAARRAGEHRRVNGVLANAPLAALWGPNPVPRAGGRCLDVVRLLRITTGSPVVEATSTRCQGVLDALRGRAAAGRQLIESARRTLTELGMRHALLEVDQFAGIVELVADDPASAETHLRRAYNGFRRMGLDADTAETAALLARACLALDREAEADELCTESEHLAGHALKASIAWRTVRAQLLARRGDHDEAKRVAEEAVALAERTDALVDHGDACVALATVLGGAGDTAGARAAAEQAVGLYERKGAAALAEKARSLLVSPSPALPVRPEPPTVELDNACVRAGGRVVDAVDRQAWGEIEQLFAPVVSIESRRKVVGFPRIHRLVSEYASEARRYHETGPVRYRQLVVAVRGERLALLRLELGTPDVSPGAPQDEFLQLYGLDEDGRIALEVWFDVEDIDAAMAELDAAHARLEAVRPRVPLENAASRGEHHFNALFADRRWDEIAALLADDIQVEERRRGIRRESSDRAKEMEEIRVIADLGVKSMTSETLAIRGERLVLSRTRFSGRDQRPDAFHTELFRVAEMDDDERLAAVVTFDLDDFEAAFEELDARYLAGEAAPYTRSWQILMDGIGELNRHERGPTLEGLSYADHRRIPFAPGDYGRAIEDLWALVPDAHYRATAVHVLDARGTVFTLAFQGTDTRGNELQWTRTCSWVFDEGRVEVYEDDDLDAALAKFDELHPHAKLENAASRVYERFWSYYNARDWTALAELVVDDLSTDDRRRVVNAGVQHGRDVEFANIRSLAEIGVSATDTVLATRGQQLVLTRCSANTDEGHGEFTADMLCLIEIDSEDHIMAGVIFDLDDIDAAFAELNARYLAGEAAPYAEVWQMLMDGADTLNRHEPGALLAQRKVAFADHRRIPFAAEDFGHATERLWALVPDVRYRAAAVHALDTHGAVINLVVEGTDAHGNELQWSATDVITFVSGQTWVEVYEEHDIDAALARFEELRPHARLENAASNAYDRIKAYFATRDWDGVREILAEDVCTDDRRRVVNAGRRQGRDAAVAEIVAIAEVGVAKVTTETIAIRGRRLALSRGRAAEADQRPDAFHTDLLDIVEVDADERVVARVIFDPDDFDAAFEELDARYLAGEAAPHAHTWSAIAHAYTAFNRRELFPTTPGWVHIDHRRGTTVAPGDLQAFIRASWHDTPDVRIYIEAVHRLDQIGAVATSASHGTSQEGFDAEWREIAVTTVHGNMISRSELFDEADLDAALARFDELNRPAPRLENAASRADDRFFAYFAARDWDSMAEAMTQGMMCDDRRRVVNAGIRRGRDVEIANMRAIAEVGVTNVTPRVVATRGERLVLTLARYSGGDPRADAFHTELIDLVEIDADNRIAACVLFEPDDIDAAFEELEARYLAGEAAAHSHTWSVAVETAAGLNRRELPSTTPDYVDVDHRSHAPFEDGDLKAYIGAVWDITPDITIYIESVHRLSNLGSVVTYVSHGTSQEGFDAEWREIVLGTVEGNLINRCELFDETDLDTALARFDELSRPAPRLENAASRVDERFNAYFAARDWDAMAEMLTDDFSNDDRRRTVNAGIRHGRDAEIANLRTLVDLGAKNMTSVVIATRGGRLALTLTRISGGDEQTEAFHAEVLQIVEIDADERYAAVVTFDDDNLDAAFEELDARYLAGEAAAHAHTWSLIARTYAAVNRHELPPTTLDHVSLDHHRAAFAPGDLIANLRAGWNQVPDVRFRVEAVHRLSNLGAVVTHAARGTSREGFEAEWREIHLTTVEGDLFNRSEMFDEADIDAALARFDELSRPAPRLENAASQVCERFRASFAARDWDAMAEMVADDLYNEDRRRAVNAGIRHGRDSMLQDMRAAADIGVTHLTAVEIATRGERLVLVHGDARTDEQPGAFHTDVLQIAEIGADERIAALVMFDPDDIDAAFEELDARYLAGEAAAYADTWSMILRLSAAFNKRELPAATPNWVNIDHRRGTAFPPGELGAYVRATWDLTPTAATYIEAVHRLDNIGAVVTQAADATSPNGFAAEWRVINLLTVEGDLMSRCEIFDEADIDAALAKFDELSRPAPRLENAASQVYGRFFGYFAARDWAALAELIANHVSVDDRRRVVNAGVRQGRDAMIAEVSAIAEVGVQSLTSHTIATRGDRLALSRVRALTSDQRHDAFDAEALNIIEVDADERVVARVVFDIDDVDAAFKELDARYLAGEAAAHAHTWSGTLTPCSTGTNSPRRRQTG